MIMPPSVSVITLILKFHKPLTPDESHAGLRMVSAIMDVGLSGRPGYGQWDQNDGFVPRASAAFDGHTVSRVECPGYDHLDLRDNSILACANGLTLFDSIRADLGVAPPQ